jgi:TRAP-type C4-dicarboxylate transport system permease small subunit
MDRIPFLSAGLDVAQRIALVVGALMIVAMMALMNVEIFARTGFGFSTQIADEFVGYFFTVSTMLCFLPALREGRFLMVESVVRRLPWRMQAVLHVLAALIGAGVSLILASSTYQLAATSFAFGTVSLQAFQTPLFIPQSVMPIGFVLLALAFTEKGLTGSRRLWRGVGIKTELSNAVD